MTEQHQPEQQDSSRRFRLPVIKRARGFYLYGADGSRYLDLWQHNGLAYRGHNPKGLSKTIKNRISTGVFSPFPNQVFPKLLKILSSQYPGYTPVVYPSAEAALHACRLLGLEAPDSLYHQWQYAEHTLELSLSLHRPDTEVSATDIIIPIIPQSATFFGQAILIKTSHPAAQELYSPGISPIQAQGLLVGLGFVNPPEKPEAKHGPTRQNKDRNQVPPPHDLPTHRFTRHERYLLPNYTKEAYFQLYKCARSSKIVLNPSFDGVSILPQWASKGDWAGLASFFEEAN